MASIYARGYSHYIAHYISLHLRARSFITVMSTINQVYPTLHIRHVMRLGILCPLAIRKWETIFFIMLF
jgi:hypothetical protein